MYSSFSLLWVLGFFCFIVVGVFAVVFLWLLGLGWYILPFLLCYWFISVVVSVFCLVFVSS